MVLASNFKGITEYVILDLGKNISLNELFKEVNLSSDLQARI